MLLHKYYYGFLIILKLSQQNKINYFMLYNNKNQIIAD